ncbi:hypothetical protein GWI33_016155 [Rhynchophorus ferrugineus]|uniref:Uncharacterized protein n=1 Tax=Rhynchophorus ferrugineus TaxID=354439 RepID=A0A834I416_RHYFE|nr:hypothetical protein GWI33_016155 [Rhynchophorus ferrugineus]
MRFLVSILHKWPENNPALSIKLNFAPKMFVCVLPNDDRMFIRNKVSIDIHFRDISFRFVRTAATFQLLFGAREGEKMFNPNRASIANFARSPNIFLALSIKGSDPGGGTGCVKYKNAKWNSDPSIRSEFYS